MIGKLDITIQTYEMQQIRYSREFHFPDKAISLHLYGDKAAQVFLLEYNSFLMPEQWQRNSRFRLFQLLR